MSLFRCGLCVIASCCELWEVNEQGSRPAYISTPTSGRPRLTPANVTQNARERARLARRDAEAQRLSADDDGPPWRASTSGFAGSGEGVRPGAGPLRSHF